MIHLLALLVITLSSIHVHENESIDPIDLIQPPMSLSTNIPVTISIENRLEVQGNTIVEPTENNSIENALKEKNIPWTLIASTITLLIGIIVIRTSEKTKRPAQEDPQIQEMLRKKTLNDLKTALLSSEKNQSPEAFFINIDTPLRKFLDAAYSINATASTADELSVKSATLKNLDPELRKKVAQIFQQIDLIKFAKKGTSQIDTHDASDTITKLINGE